ncbi:tyrosine-type recombinase/integrase [uncultured Draconibacterium sp.]|uniref:site-specific integrase n=1 Tax=uncultured Draconibacterium sp. TaxID=1573823 RepID=UPI0032600E72
MAIKVTLRETVISKNRRSLYLDFYPGFNDSKTGKLKRREVLRMYVVDKPRTKAERAFNKDTRAEADKIRAQRQVELNRYSAYTDDQKKEIEQKKLSEGCFVSYYQGIVEGKIARRTIKKKQTEALKREGDSIWKAGLLYLRNYTEHEQGHPAIAFNELTADFFNGFRDYLLTADSLHNKQGKKISQNSASVYFSKVYSTLLQAEEKGFLTKRISNDVVQIESQETHREVLTIAELKKLIEIECEVPLLKRAALFSALTGLRISDIKKLKWSEITFDKDSGRYRMPYRQQKTTRINYMVISEQAVKLAGERGAPDKLVFDGLSRRYTSYHLQKLYNWVLRSGITKTIKFHNFRHTYATLQLEAGTDIYTVSKNLGHTNLKTTEIYAKIVDSKKEAAADAIDLGL